MIRLLAAHAGPPSGVTLNGAYLLLAILSSIVTVVAGVGVLVRWIYRQGGSGQRLSSSIERLGSRMGTNTEATTNGLRRL